MEHKENNEPILPRKFAHLENDLQSSRQQLDQIDQEIDQIPRDRGPRYELRTPNQQDMPFNRQGMIKQMRDRKANVTKNFNEKLEPELVGIDPKLAGNVQNVVDDYLSDEYNKKNMEKFATDKKDVNPVDFSQQFMNRRLANYQSEISRSDAKTDPSTQKSLDTLSEPGKED